MSHNPEVSHIAEIRRHVPLGLSAVSNPIEAGTVTAGSRTLYLLITSNNGSVESPTFAIGDQSSDEAVPIFSTRESAVHFLQVTGWNHYQIHLVSPRDVRELLQRMAEEGVRYIMVDPNRQDQERGVTQALLDLESVQDMSGENLFQEIAATAKSQA